LIDSVVQGILGLIEALNRVFEPEAHETEKVPGFVVDPDPDKEPLHVKVADL
jgi:hypothetical protein